jgi:hypothetical protein
MPVFDNLAQGTAPEVNFTVNENDYNMGYYLVDGIYLPWATLDQWLFIPSNEQTTTLCKKQSRYRKDVECVFGVMQAKYVIIKVPARLWSQKGLKYIVDYVIILHNMGIF